MYNNNLHITVLLRCTPTCTYSYHSVVRLTSKSRTSTNSTYLAMCHNIMCSIAIKRGRVQSSRILYNQSANLPSWAYIQPIGNLTISIYSGTWPLTQRARSHIDCIARQVLSVHRVTFETLSVYQAKTHVAWSEENMFRHPHQKILRYL